MNLPKPFYQDDAVTLYHGDCVELVHLLGKFDLLLTDPPYGINGATGTLNQARSKGDYAGSWEDSPDYLRSVVVPLIERARLSCTAVVLTPGNKNFCLYPQPDSFGSFYQPAAVGMQVFGNNDSQPIFYYGSNPTRKNLGKPLSFILTERPAALGHPCSKPEKAWGRLLTSVSIEGQTVLDPFAGSGTTGRACKDLGRKCTMIEREKSYCEIIARRMAQEVFDFS